MAEDEVPEDPSEAADEDLQAIDSDLPVDAFDDEPLDLKAGELHPEIPPPYPQALLVSPTAQWSYLQQPAKYSGQTCRHPLSAAWTSAIPFSEPGWVPGNAELGYGDGDERTVINFGSSSSNKCITQYFRRTFSFDTSLYSGVTIRLLRDDGAVVYINGTEVARSNMPAGTITPTTLASSTVEGSAEDTFFTFTLAGPPLVNGDNVIAVEVHQRSASNVDLSFDLELDGILAPKDPSVRKTTSFVSSEATIDESSPHSNLGTSSFCRIDGASGTNNTGLSQVCLARWDLTSNGLPAGAIIRAAHLDLTVTNPSPDRYGVFPLATSWVEDLVTWEDRNGILESDWQTTGGQVGGHFGATDLVHPELPITVVNALTTGERILTLPPDLVAGWFTNPTGNRGLAFFNPTPVDGLDFDATGLGLELVITYDTPAPAPLP